MHVENRDAMMTRSDRSRSVPCIIACLHDARGSMGCDDGDPLHRVRAPVALFGARVNGGSLLVVSARIVLDDAPLDGYGIMQ